MLVSSSRGFIPRPSGGTGMRGANGFAAKARTVKKKAEIPIRVAPAIGNRFGWFRLYLRRITTARPACIHSHKIREPSSAAQRPAILYQRAYARAEFWATYFTLKSLVTSAYSRVRKARVTSAK